MFCTSLGEVDLANVDTSNPMESSNRWIQALESWASQRLRIKTKDFEIIEIGVDEGVNLGSGIEDSLLPSLVL